MVGSIRYASSDRRPASRAERCGWHWTRSPWRAAEGRDSDRVASREITIRGKEKVTVLPPVDPRVLVDLCTSGFVWRDAFEGDHVCVTPEHRDQAAQDNAAAASRVDPNGAFGPNSCVVGYVWRVAKPDDLVCVTAEERDRVAVDNAEGPSRRAP